MISICANINRQFANGNGRMKINIDVPTGSFTAIYGASGAGKTTLLRILSGLIKPSEGQLYIDNECWFDSEHQFFLKPSKRSVGVVFQDYAVFPNLTVRGNIEYALNAFASWKICKPFKMISHKYYSYIEELLVVTGLEQLADTRPHLLSGGQRQRLAIARALVCRPEILLLDEPFAALDSDTRGQMQILFKAVHDRYGLTTFMVTHDVHDIKELADHMITMDNGKVVQSGNPHTVLSTYFGRVENSCRVVDIRTKMDMQVLIVSQGDRYLEIEDYRGCDIKIGDEVVIEQAENLSSSNGKISAFSCVR